MAIFAEAVGGDFCVLDQHFNATLIETKCGQWPFTSNSTLAVAAGFSVGAHNFILASVNLLANSPFFIESLWSFEKRNHGLRADRFLAFFLGFLALALDIGALIAVLAATHSEKFTNAVLSVGLGSPVLAGIGHRLVYSRLVTSTEVKDPGDIPATQAPKV